jgi:hypothetical protein
VAGEAAGGGRAATQQQQQAAASEPLGRPAKLAKQGSSNAAAAAAALARAPATAGDTGSEPQIVTERQPTKQQKQQRQAQGQQQQLAMVKYEPRAEDAAKAAAAGAVAGGSSRRVLEVHVEPPKGGPWVTAHLQLSQINSFVDLWRQLQAALPVLGLGQQGRRLKVVYMDAAGDWVLALPDQRWQSFVEVAKRVLVTTG